jgi:hypothetical protein
MAKKRAPGGGRKPKGDTSRTAQLTVRVPEAMRSQLESGAKERGWTLTDELMWRLRNSFNREREERRDPAIRGLCYLIAELAHHVTGGLYAGNQEVAFFNWRADPFFYRAFKIAIGKLLDAIEPPGPITAPTIDVSNPKDVDDYPQHWLETMQTPEARAEFAVNHVIGAFRTLPRITDKQREEATRLVGEHTAAMHQFYGMPDAARDLAFKPRSGEMVKVNAIMKTIELGDQKTGDSNG